MRWGGVLLIVSACADPGLSYPQYLDAVEVASCGRLVRCHAMPDVATCLQHATRWPAEPTMLAAIDAGVVVWHADRAQACVDTIEALTCDETSIEYRHTYELAAADVSPSACSGLITGTLGDGAPCSFASECLSGECWLESALVCDDAGCCRGTCVGDQPAAAQPNDGVCRYAPCLDGWCDDSVCRPLLAEGAPCDAYADRFYNQVCDYGLICSGGTCIATAGTGESCVDRPCHNEGETCGMFQHICIPRYPLGTPCTRDDQCMSPYVCDATQRCVEPPPTTFLPVGATCTLRGPACESPAFCDVDYRNGKFEGVCIAPRGLGEPCDWDGQCASGHCNNLGVCIADACL